MSSSPDSNPRTANSASAPLPIIPRRSSAIRSQSGLQTLTPSSSPVKITLQQASPPNKQTSSPDSDSDESSSSTAPHVALEVPKKPRLLRPKQDRVARSSTSRLPDLVSSISDPSQKQEGAKDRSSSANAVERDTKSPDISTSSASSMASSSQPSVAHLIHIPGTPLKLTLEKLKLSSTSPTKISAHPDMGATIRSAGAVLPPIPPVIRKKSGQLVKSSLKASKPVIRGSLSVVTGAVASKSEPATPKAVHFDSHLEHVKLFLAEQKPLAVSRDGSPDDTSGTDSDFPPFIFGPSSDDQKRKKLVMQVVNMPTLVDQKADVALLELKLAPDTTNIVGKVRVRNISFHKWVAVRFTFDAWQTTSEVTGKYVQSVDNFDIFGFSIKLDDLMARIDGKTLILAVRYSVSGQEFWDNNRGQNYLATFSKTTIPVEKPPVSSELSAPAGANVADLRDRLEKVVRGRERERVQNSAKKKDSLLSRYDLTSSLKEPPFSPTILGQPRSHIRTQSSPAEPPARKSSSLSPPPSLARNFVHKTVVQPKVTLGSPRDLDNETFRPAPFVHSDLDDPPFPVPPVTRVARNHQRGYFDLEVPPRSSVRRTALGSPHDASTVQSRFRSALGLGLTPRDAVSTESSGSELSTPSILSPSSASSGSSSMSPSPTEGFLVPGLIKDSPIEDGASYNQFLDKCVPCGLVDLLLT